VVGCDVVRNAGQFGYLQVYGVQDEGDVGMVVGETVGWRVNGVVAKASDEIRWQNDRTAHSLELDLDLDAAMPALYLPLIMHQ
jgi:hypothetical protein